MNTFSQSFTIVTRSFFTVLAVVLTLFSLQAQCDLAGRYTNQREFQTALDNAAANSCTKITLTGSAQYTGDITIPNGTFLVIAGSATINGNGTLTSQNPIEILKGGALETNNRVVTVAGYTYSNLGTVKGPITLNGIAFRVLSVEWLNFAVKSAGNTHVLAWETASEINNSYFIIERSHNGADFKAIGQVQATGKTQDKTAYTFTDATPSVGVNYYRLQAVDAAGKASPSKIVSANNVTTTTIFKAYPTVQVGAALTVEVAGLSAVTQLSIVNAMGQIIQHIPLSNRVNDSILSISTEALPSGFYLLSLRDGKNVRTIKFSKS